MSSHAGSWHNATVRVSNISPEWAVDKHQGAPSSIVDMRNCTQWRLPTENFANSKSGHGSPVKCSGSFLPCAHMR
jgi:hypothetical protein